MTKQYPVKIAAMKSRDYVRNRNRRAGWACSRLPDVTLDLESEAKGKKSHIRIDGVFTCAVNDQGLLRALRGYWSRRTSSSLRERWACGFPSSPRCGS